MASPENLATFESWALRNPFAGTWFSDAIARDSEVLTRALQDSFSGSNEQTINTSDTSISPVMNIIGSGSAAFIPEGSGLSGPDHESVPEVRRSGTIPVKNGKVSKRKSRESKKSQTTFIMTDPANFLQMVQQVTGSGFDTSSLSMRPESERPVSRSMPDVFLVGCLHTLDTSALFLDPRHNTLPQQMMVGPATESGPRSSPLYLGPVLGPGASNDIVDSIGFCRNGFPSLDSWKFM